MKIEDVFDRVFIINLDRRPDRWAECEEQIERSGIKRYLIERVSGYDHPTNGHAGCTRSHRELLKRVATGKWRRVLVLEDDFQILTLDELKKGGFIPTQDVWKTFCSVMGGGGHFTERFGYLSDFLPDEWDVIYLGAAYGEPPISRLNKHVIRCGFMQTTSSYGITREFAQVWTDKVDAGCNHSLEFNPGPIDNVFGNMAHDHLYYVFQPRLLFQRNSRSDITGLSNSYLYSMTDPVHEGMV